MTKTEMEIIGSTEDTISASEKTRKVHYTIQMDGPEGTCYIDVMVSDSGLAYVMENADGTAVYGADGGTYPDVVYDELQALQLARQAFEEQYGGRAHERVDKEGTGTGTGTDMV